MKVTIVLRIRRVRHLNLAAILNSKMQLRLLTSMLYNIADCDENAFSE